ncbi:MAG: CvpA family protein [Myxococcales bacterium]
MKIDLAVAVFVGFFGLMGLFSGAIRQLGHLGGLLAGYLLARPLAQIVAPLVATKFGYPPLFASIACSFMLFFALYVIGTMLVRAILTKAFPDGERGALNRVGGLMLGSGKAALILFVILSGLVFLERPIGQHFAEFRRETKSSIAMALARRHNLFSSLPQVSGLARLAEAARNPEAQAKLAEDPNFRALQKDARMQSLVNDASVRNAFETGDYSAILGSVKVLNVLNDPKLADKLSDLSKAQ